MSGKSEYVKFGRQIRLRMHTFACYAMYLTALITVNSPLSVYWCRKSCPSSNLIEKRPENVETGTFIWLVFYLIPWQTAELKS